MLVKNTSNHVGIPWRLIKYARDRSIEVNFSDRLMDSNLVHNECLSAMC